MSEHKSSQNQNSHANMNHPQAGLTQQQQAAGQQMTPNQLNNQNTVLVNQLQIVLNALKCLGNRPDEPIQIV